MIGLFPTGKTKKQISLKKFLLTFFVCVSVVTWIGISTIFADEDDPADNMENTEHSFQNAAQEQHAKNIAIKAALQDPKVIEAISKAKESGELDDFKAARAQFKETVADITQQISDMRAERGWGEIAKEFGVHPRYLGLGHYKHKAKYATHTKHESQNYNGHNKNRGLALGHSKDKSGGHGVGHGRGNGGGNGGGHGRGKK
jgi:hypothetical protein